MKHRTWMVVLLAALFLAVPSTGLALNETDFKPLATGGFGDSANSYSWGLIEFNGDVYVSTNRHHLWSMMIAMSSLFGQEIPFEDLIEGPPGYLGTEQWANAHQAEIWRLKSGAWEKVYKSDNFTLTDGPYGLSGVFPVAYGYRTLGTFEGYIYALGVGTWMPPLPFSSIVRSRSGDRGTWEDVTGNLAGTTNVRSFVEWKGHVYLAASVSDPDGIAGAGGCVIFRNKAAQDPETNDRWEAVSEVGFGDKLNVEIYYLAVFNDYLYASTVNYVNGFEVWKTDGTVDNGKLVWQQILKEGFGDTWVQYGMTMQAFGDHLYIGTAVGAGMVLKDGEPSGTRAIDIIRLDKNDKAELVVGAYVPSDPPPGWPTYRVPLSRLPAGFGNPFNVYTWHMTVYKDWLLAGTFDLTGIMLFALKEFILSDPAAAMQLLQQLLGMETSLPLDKLEELKSLKLADGEHLNQAFQIIDYLQEKFGGADLWKTKDGIHWKPVVFGGFENWHNYGFRRLVPIDMKGKQVLFVATANPFTGVEGGGCEVWANISQVSIDIKQRTINPNNQGVIPVVVLTTGDFDSATIVSETVRFGPAGAKPQKFSLTDFDGDGRLDMMFHFNTQDTGIKSGDTSATLIGSSSVSGDFFGSDKFKTVP